MPVDYAVVNAYARVCTNKWKGMGVNWKTTLDVVVKVRSLPLESVF